MTISAARIGPGYVGHFATAAALAAKYPASDYAGRTATVELSAGIATLYCSDGNQWYQIQNPNGTVTPAAVQLGGAGSTVVTALYRVAVALTPVAVAANTTAEQLFAVAGVAVGDAVFVNKATAQAGLGIVGARVSAAGQIGITFSNNTAAAITPTAAETYQVAGIR